MVFLVEVSYSVKLCRKSLIFGEIRRRGNEIWMFLEKSTKSALFLSARFLERMLS